MHTLIRDQDISKHDFVFYSDRLIRLVSSVIQLILTSDVEHGYYIPVLEILPNIIDLSIGQ